MSIGNEIAYRRSRRGKDSTGSLVFDQERKRSGALQDAAAAAPKKSGSSVAAGPGVKQAMLKKFPG